MTCGVNLSHLHHSATASYSYIACSVQNTRCRSTIEQGQKHFVLSWLQKRSVSFLPEGTEGRRTMAADAGASSGDLLTRVLRV